MSCNRKNCDTILCDTYVPHVGYICHECQREFGEFIDKRGIDPQTEGEIVSALSVFMQTDKVLSSSTPMTVREFFDKHS